VSRLRVAVVGVGRLGRHHARIYSEMPDLDLVGVVDRDRAVAEAIAGERGTRAFADLRELPPIDAVSVAVPTRDHAAVASWFLERGIATLVEKPLASTLEEAGALVELARRHRAPLQVGHVERFNPAIIAIDRMGIRPRFIEVHRLSPFPFRSVDIGVVLDVMIHDIDVLLHLVRCSVRRVEAIGVNVLSSHEDIANARLLFENGCLANVTASRVSTRTERKIRFFSEDCYVSLDYEKKQGVVYRKSRDLASGKIDPESIDPNSLDDPKAFLFGSLIDVTQLDLTDHEPLRAELESFVACTREGRKPVVSGEDALLAMATAKRILEAIEEFRRENWKDLEVPKR
jgi:predicted dehydrogenase